MKKRVKKAGTKPRSSPWALGVAGWQGGPWGWRGGGVGPGGGGVGPGHGVVDSAEGKEAASLPGSPDQ